MDFSGWHVDFSGWHVDFSGWHVDFSGWDPKTIDFAATVVQKNIAFNIVCILDDDF